MLTKASLKRMGMWDGGKEGRVRKERELAAHEDRHPERMAATRDFARVHYENQVAENGRSAAYVTSDQVREFCDTVGIPRGPWMGSVFRGRHWRAKGFMKSKDPKQHAATIRMWRHVK